MSLSCDNDYCPEPGDTSWWIPKEWKHYNFKRAPKCCSCGEKIREGGFGKDYLTFRRFKVPEYDVEIRIYGEDGEIPRAPWHMCFECGWRYQALERAGYAITIHEDMRRLFIEHENMKLIGMDGCT